MQRKAKICQYCKQFGSDGRGVVDCPISEERVRCHNFCSDWVMANRFKGLDIHWSGFEKVGDKKCSNCRWFVRVDGDVQCWLLPPVVVWTGKGWDQRCPTVWGDSFCSKWEREVPLDTSAEPGFASEVL